MRFPSGLLRDFLAILPPTSSIGTLPNGATPWAGISDPGFQQTSASALLLQQALFQGLGPAGQRNPVNRHQLFVGTSYGFIAVDQGIEQQLAKAGKVHVLAGFVFGAAVLRARGGVNGRQRLLGALSLNGVEFPVIEIAGKVSNHGLPPSPGHVMSSSTCWAQATQAFTPTIEGILTAAHVLSSVPLGARISMTPSAGHSSPTTSTVYDVAPSPIDAALLEVSSSIPSGLSRLNILDPARVPIAPGSPMQLEGSVTMQTGTVLRVNQNPGYYGPMLAERVVFDVHGKPGDSGGLVADPKTVDGLGIYMGEIPSNAGGTSDGVAQGLWQATQYLDVTDIFI